MINAYLVRLVQHRIDFVNVVRFREVLQASILRGQMMSKFQAPAPPPPPLYE